MLNVKKCVKTCIDKYNLSESEALRIAKTDNILLSIEELRYKYDNEKIGTAYPDWITPEEHLKMCYATVYRKYYGNEYLSKDFYSIDDVASDLFLQTSLHIHSYQNKYQLNGILLCRMRNLLRDKTTEAKLYYETYNWEDENIEVNNESTTNYSKAMKYNSISRDTTDTTELLLTISSIKNDRIQGILLICGYFLANIQEFLEPLVKYYNQCSDKVKSKIYDLGRDDIYFCNAIHKKTDITNVKNITIGRILKIFGKRDKSYLVTELLPYLKNIGFMPVNL